jgi:Rieske Fe-S protein
MWMNRRDFISLTAAGVACAHLTDVAHAAVAPPAPLDVGAPADYRTDRLYDTFVKSHKIWVLRDHNRLYAFTAVCPHRGCTIKAGGEDGLACPCHTSRFTPDGAVTKGPAQTSLLHFAITLKDNRILVDPTKTFRESHWDDDGASIPLP